MRPESERLWLQGEEDLETARILLKTHRYYAAAFFSHQAAEKFLKATYLEVAKDVYPKTHNLVELGRLLHLDDIMEDLMELNPEYMISRYPDAANGVPAHMYNENIAKRHLERAERVREVCLRILERSSRS